MDASERVRGPVLRVRPSSRGLLVAAGVFVMAFGVMGVRALQLGLGASPAAPSVLDLERRGLAWRGDLVDRHGEILATTLDAYVLAAKPDEVWDPRATAQALVSVLGELDVEDVVARLSDTSRGQVWLARGVTPSERDAIFAKGLPGVVFEIEPRRLYPRGRLGAHVIGFTTVDGEGVAGAEAAFDARLREGETVRLSLDLRVQHVLDEELRESLATFGARRAAGLVMHAHTGEVLAMVSLPDYDPNAPSAFETTAQNNLALGGRFELGSVFKPVTYAIAFDNQSLDNDTELATTPLAAGGHEITDFSRNSPLLTPRHALRVSSNTAAARTALLIDPVVLQGYFSALGLLAAPDTDLPEAAAPLLPVQWGVVERATIGFGHGMAMSPTAFAAAFASVVNGGFRVSPRFEVGSDRPDRLAVFAPETSAELIGWMRGVVEQGTGHRAQVDGYALSGKTGTAEKARAGGYDESRNLTSFVAAFPGDTPEYVVFVMLDEPARGQSPDDRPMGGTTAAPTVAAIVTRIGPILGLRPRREEGAG